MNNKLKELKNIANTIRQDIILMLSESKSGHAAGSLGVTDIITALYFDFLNINPKKPNAPERDYFILSNGHVCPALYSALARKKYFNKTQLLTLRKLGSKLQGHPHRETLPGIETTSGPLGSGLSQATGIALVLKRENKQNKVVCMTSDGEHQEGNTWEAIMLASKYELNNLIVIIDRNRIQIDGSTEDVMPLKSLKEKYLSFGWGAIEINGNDMEQILHALHKTQTPRKKPIVIIANTIPGKGVSFIENKYEWHGKTPSPEETKKAIYELKHRRLA